MRGRTALAAFTATSIAAVVLAQAPLPVAERSTRHGGTATRVSLFSNRVVAVTIASEGVQSFVRTLTLPEDQYLIYLGILEEAAGELGERPVNSDVSTSRDSVELTIHLGPEAPRRIGFSPMATVSLPLARILGALDDLEALVRSSSPSAEELRTWEPRRGDRVELLTGGFARVVEVFEEEGVLVLEHESTYIRQVVPADARDDVILHVLERAQ